MPLKKLPIEINAVIKSDCGTFYKMAIMQTMPTFDEWLAGHMDTFTNQAGKVVLGRLETKSPLSYFTDMLDIRETNIFTYTSEQIIDYIITATAKGNFE